MSELLKRSVRIFFTYGIRTLSLLFAVSVVSFVLISASPINPVQQYLIGLDRKSVV